MSLNVSGCHWMSLNVIECHWVALNVTGCHWMSFNVSECHWMSLNVSECQWMSLDVWQWHWMSLNVRRDNVLCQWMSVSAATRLHRVWDTCSYFVWCGIICVVLSVQCVVLPSCTVWYRLSDTCSYFAAFLPCKSSPSTRHRTALYTTQWPVQIYRSVHIQHTDRNTDKNTDTNAFANKIINTVRYTNNFFRVNLALHPNTEQCTAQNRQM